MRLKGGYSIEVIATGDEILFGRIIDTNSSWIARKALERGGQLRRITCVGDEMDQIARALREALSRDNDLIILTGGLGASEDDLTIQAVGRALGRGMKIDGEAVKIIRAKCAELGVESTPRRERMAHLLEGSKPIPNPVGMAVGMVLQEEGTTIVALPGVPEEMKAMFDAYVAPMIGKEAASKYLAETVTVRIVWKNFFPMYRSVTRDFRDVYLKNSITPPLRAEERDRVQDIRVYIVVEAASKAECEGKMDAFLREFRNRVEASGGELVARGR